MPKWIFQKTSTDQKGKDYLDKTDGTGTSLLPLCYINYLETLIKITALIKFEKVGSGRSQVALKGKIVFLNHSFLTKRKVRRMLIELLSLIVNI